MYKMYLNKIDLSEHQNKIHDIIEMLMCNTEHSDYELYKHVQGELYEMANGKRLNDELAHEWVKNMKPVGEYWSKDNTIDAMRTLGYSDEPVDFYIVANMMKNDYHDLIQGDDELALKLAHDWLNDEDAKECKLYEYWKHIIKHHIDK